MGKQNINTEAIVLKRINFKEADRIITLYTKELGKVTARAIGIRKLTSKKKSHLELLNSANISLVEGNAWYIITQADLSNSFDQIKKNLETVKLAYYIAEVFNLLIPESEQDKNLFQFLSKTLEALNNNPSLKITNAFNLKLLNILGFYSRSTFYVRDESTRNQMTHMLNSTYEELLNEKNDTNEQITIHQILKSLTEEVLEREIKTKL